MHRRPSFAAPSFTSVDPARALTAYASWIRAQGESTDALEVAVTDAPDDSRPALSARPKVSALMVSHSDLRFVTRAVRCYLAQTYENRELVIVRDPKKPATEVARYVETLGRDDIRVVVPAGSPTLAALRNISVESADGEILCQWDDDDLSHPERMVVQLEALRTLGSNASFLQDTFDLFVDGRELSWIDWGRSLLGCFPATVMWQRGRLRYTLNPNFVRRREDLLLFLRMKRKVASVAGAPYLYVYTDHGGNTWDDAHSRRRVLELLVVSSEGHEQEFASELSKLGLVVRPCTPRDNMIFSVDSTD